MLNQNNAIAIATAAGHFFFSTEEIVRLEASSNYTNIHFTNRKKIVSAKVLKEYAALLEPLGFIRIHRTHLVNPRHIAFVRRSGMVVMKDESVAEISRRMKRNVMQALTHAA